MKECGLEKASTREGSPGVKPSFKRGAVLSLSTRRLRWRSNSSRARAHEMSVRTLGRQPAAFGPASLFVAAS